MAEARHDTAQQLTEPVKKIKIPKGIYKYPIHYWGGVAYFTTSKIAYDKLCKAVNLGSDVEVIVEGAGMTSREFTLNGEVAYLVGVFDKDPSTCLHEVIHLCIFVLDRAGVDPRDDSGEAFAYMVEHFTQVFTARMFTPPKESKKVQDESTTQTVS